MTNKKPETKTAKERARELEVELHNFLKTHKPYLIKIEELLAKNKSGVVKFDVRVFEGRVTDLVVTEVLRYTFKK